MQPINTWLAIWSRPKMAIRAAVEKNPKGSFFVLAMITGLQLLLFLNGYYAFSAMAYNFPVFLMGAVILAPFIGFACIYFFTLLIYLPGKWLGGKAAFRLVSLSVAWSKAPMIIDIVMWLMLFVFISQFFSMQFLFGASLIFFNAVFFITAVWSLVILIQALSEVEQFSVGRAIASIALAYLFLLVACFIVVYLSVVVINF